MLRGDDLRSIERRPSRITVLSRQIARLASLGMSVVAGRLLATDIRIQVGFGGGTVAICRDGLIMDVIHLAGEDQYSGVDEKGQKRVWSDIRKGPRDASGKPETEMAKLTPVPFALEVPAT